MAAYTPTTDVNLVVSEWPSIAAALASVESSELAAIEPRQDANGEEELLAAVDPSAAVERDASSRDDAVDMGMQGQLLAPGMEHRQNAEVLAHAKLPTW